MSKRNRAEGWTHAKRSGHDNEHLVEKLFSQEGTFQFDFLKRLGKENTKIIDVNIGGLHETNVKCVLGGMTKSKTDLKVKLSDGSCFNISIKKSLGGQVYLISADRFISGFEAQFSRSIPESVKKAISLFWGSIGDVSAIVEKFGVSKVYENKKNRLVADTLKAYDINLYNVLLQWFKDETRNIFSFCFSTGMAKNLSDWANVVWYINKLDENDVDEMFLISELSGYFEEEANHNTEYGRVGGGTTIQLAFGFVQWHSPTKKIPGDIQFHHNYNKIKAIVDRCKRK